MGVVEGERNEELEGKSSFCFIPPCWDDICLQMLPWQQVSRNLKGYVDVQVSFMAIAAQNNNDNNNSNKHKYLVPSKQITVQISQFASLLLNQPSTGQVTYP